MYAQMGQHMVKVGNSKRKSDSGYVSNTFIYEAKNCVGCPLKSLCHNSKRNRRIEVNHNLNRHKEKARQLLTSEEGIFHRKQRPTEPEVVFGQSKANMQYYRFRHFGKEKVMMDFSIFAIAFNLQKMIRKKNRTSKNRHKKRK